MGLYDCVRPLICIKTTIDSVVTIRYNKVNGLHASENPFLLKQVLRKEWGSEATVMSDWFGVYSISDSINAGLDLEMPGTRKFRGEHPMGWSIHSRKMTLQTVKARAKKVIGLVQRAANGAPEVGHVGMYEVIRIIDGIDSFSMKITPRNRLTRKRIRH